MAVISTWVSGSTAGTFTVGVGLPSIVVDIPANRTLKRVVIFGSAAGVQHGNGNVNTFGPISLRQVLDLGFPTTGIRRIYDGSSVMRFSAVGVDDHNLLTSNRVYTMYHGGGDKDFGCNLQMSYGGPVSPAMRLTLGNTFTHIISGATSFSMTVLTMQMKALYQRTV